MRDATSDHQRRFGNRLGVALVRLGFLREDALVSVLARQLALPVVRLAGKRIAPEVLARVPHALMEKHGCLPLFLRREGDGDVLYLATADPCDRGVLDDIARVVGLRVSPVLVAPTDLHEAVSRLLRVGDEACDVFADPNAETASSTAADTTPLLPSGAPMRPREVRTRVILHALTQLLIEKGVIERGALVARVEALDRARDA